MRTTIPSAVVRPGAAVFLAISLFSVTPPAEAGIKTIYDIAKITAPDGAPGDWFGAAVSISGNLAIVGAQTDFDNGDDSGSAYIYAFDGTNWNFQAKLLASDGAPFDSFGVAVAISGNTALVGAWGNSSVVSLGGAVYVFTFDGTAWTQQAKLIPSDLVKASGFGYSIALSGNTAIIGAPLSAGAYVFTFDGTNWIEQAKLSESVFDNVDAFGLAVALSGNRALVGAPNKGSGADYQKGAAYVFRLDGSTWSQEAELTALDGATFDRFGSVVSLSGDTALIGAPYKARNRGAAYIFHFDGTSWNQQKLNPGGGQKDNYFGYCVALSNTAAVVGAQQLDKPGTLYQFSLRRNTWKLEAQLFASDGMGNDKLGTSVSMEGNTVLAGARFGNSENGADTGAAYFFSLGR